MRYLPELTGSDPKQIHRAELIRYNTNYEFEDERWDKYFLTFTDASDWIQMVDCHGKVTKDAMNRRYKWKCNQ